jgi:hypothetical protein
MPQQINAITLTRTNGIGDMKRKHERQAARVNEFATRFNINVEEEFNYNVSENDTDGIADMMCTIIGYLIHHPHIKCILVADLNRVCRSYWLYELFDNTVSRYGVTIEAPTFYGVNKEEIV